MNTQTAVKDRTEDLALTQGNALATVQPRGNVVPLSQGPKLYPPKIAKALMTMTREFGAIEKNGVNSFHNYKYQMWEDVLQRESELVAAHGLIIQQSEVARSLLDKLISISYEFTIINEDGDVWPDRPVWTTIGRLQDNKGMFDDKAANKCHTQAHKYFLLHLFKIKTREVVEDDTDADTSPGNQSQGNPALSVVAQEKGAQPWADAFVAAINAATDLDPLIRANKDKLTKLKADFAPIHAAVVIAITNRRAALAAPQKAPETAPTNGKAKLTAAPKKPAIPNPTDDGPGWIKWLGEKFAAFKTYEEGETYWNETVMALDIPDLVQEDAMGVWSGFERRFEP